MASSLNRKNMAFLCLGQDLAGCSFTRLSLLWCLAKLGSGCAYHVYCATSCATSVTESSFGMYACHEAAGAAPLLVSCRSKSHECLLLCLNKKPKQILNLSGCISSAVFFHWGTALLLVFCCTTLVFPPRYYTIVKCSFPPLIILSDAMVAFF